VHIAVRIAAPITVWATARIAAPIAVRKLPLAVRIAAPMGRSTQAVRIAVRIAARIAAPMAVRKLPLAVRIAVHTYEHITDERQAKNMNILLEIAERSKQRVEDKKRALPLQSLIHNLNQSLCKTSHHGITANDFPFEKALISSGFPGETATRLSPEAHNFPFETPLVRQDNPGDTTTRPSPEAHSISFEKALRSPGSSGGRRGKDISFICEIKRASPSKGIIAEDFPYLDIARDYENAGAAAISVLTEPHYFKGDDRFLREIADVVSIPLLRKDFTVDVYMIYEAKMLGASAVLLICSILDRETLAEYIRVAHNLGLSALVEVHNEGEVETALEAGARIIGVNNRDLNTFEVDTGVSIRLRKLVPAGIIFVSESGVRKAADIQTLRQNGVDAVLIGETLMRSSDKRAALASLRGISDEQG